MKNPRMVFSVGAAIAMTALLIVAARLYAQIPTGVHTHPMIPALSKADRAFIRTAGMAGNGEVMLGREAPHHGSSPAVQAFATRMVRDHTAIGNKLAAVASGLGVDAPNGTDAGHYAEYAKLGLLHGKTFDHEYAKYVVKDHIAAVGLFRSEAGNPDANPQLRAFAHSTLPTIEMHLAMARALPQ